MMQRLTLFLITLLTTAAFAQDLPRIAVYVTGDVPDNEKSALGTRILAALVNSGRYMGIERSAAFLAEIEKEHVKQRSGAIDDGQISELGRQFGVKHICITNITPAFGAYQVSARIVNVETAVVAFIGESHSPLKTMDDLTQVSDEVVRIMFGGQAGSKPAAAKPKAKQDTLPQKPKIKMSAVDGLARTLTVPSSEAATISAAMAIAQPGDIVVVSDGIYRERVVVAPGVALVARNMYGAVINGRGRGYVVTMGANSSISGFEIRHGTVGVFSNAQSEIRHCRIMHNFQCGILSVNSLPIIEDNIIAYNKGTGIHGWNLHRDEGGSVNHNTIAYNGGHGIALGGNTSALVENNIIAFNDLFGIWQQSGAAVQAELVNNNFYRNARGGKETSFQNIRVDPAFANARQLDFKLRNDLSDAGADTDKPSLGARVSQ